MPPSSVIPALCINLDGATERWAHVQTQAARWLAPLGLPLVRIEAVHWRSLLSSPPSTNTPTITAATTTTPNPTTTTMDTMDDVPMTPFTRWLLQGGTVRQRNHRASHRQMDTPSP